MIKQDIDTLIIKLLAIANYAKDIHYNCSGANFYGDHLFADRLQEGLYDYIDQLKEICLLGHGLTVAHSSNYLKAASEIIPQDIGFISMQNLLIGTLHHIEHIQNLAKGDENLIGAIAQDIQNNLGLINIMLGDNKIV